MPDGASRAPIAIVILNWNGADDTLECLASIDAQTLPPSELVVLDNGSSDDSVPRIRAAHPELELVVSPVNLGFAEGANRGIGHTTAPWVLLLNNDVVLAPDALARLAEAADRAPADVGMMQPLLLFKDRPGIVNSSGVILFREGSAVDRHFGRPLDGAIDYAEEPFAVTAGAGLYRRAMLESIRLPTGYLDRTHFMYFEDVDLGWRARLAGWRAQAVPDARGHHGFQRSSTKHSSHFVEQHCKLNRIRMVLKNASVPMVRTFLCSRRLRRDLVWLLRKSGHRGGAAFVSALWCGWSSRSRVSSLLRTPRADLEAVWIRQRRPGVRRASTGG